MTNKESVCQKIFNSHTYSGWFENAVAQSSFKAGRTLSAAKHRFCSFSKPLTRFIMHLDSIIAVLNRIVAVKGSEGAWATRFLRGLTQRKLLLLAMCADMADATIQLTRFLDSEDMDIASMNEEVSIFCARLEACLQV